ncbi:MAG TPA: DNA-processing protein DprA [Candidatus Deferrimicrobiaceae bacterium]|nr:DNA-processing protein DprA [Candidatus Deferrimicrobiaceae bacterium]
MPSEQTPDDILLRLSLVEGFTARHLAWLGAARGPAAARPVGDSLPGRSLLQKGIEAAGSREAGERAQEVREACARAGVRIVPLGSEGYPPLLASIADAPLVLYWWGSGTACGKTVAVVGSRAPTDAGKEFARGLAADLSFRGVSVVSGMARGIDAAAHEGALEAGGETVAVLGCGVDVLYPPESGRLRKKILVRGAVVSEFPPGTQPLPWRFPARNRLISGMARAVVVAEAPAKSGALITAGFALEQGREVMAVPGSPLFPHAEGSNRLLQEGAAMVTGVDDVLVALGWTGGPCLSSSKGALGEEEGEGDLERRILRFLSVERHVNDIAGSLNVPVQELLPRLLDMEFRKLLERRRGDYYKNMSKSGRHLRVRA